MRLDNFECEDFELSRKDEKMMCKKIEELLLSFSLGCLLFFPLLSRKVRNKIKELEDKTEE